QDDPAVGRRDALVLADAGRLLAEDLALEEHAARLRGKTVQAIPEDLPETSLLERRLGIVPCLRRGPPVARLVEHFVEPRLVLVDEPLLVDVDSGPLGAEASLQIEHLETKDRGEPRAQGRAAIETADALERRKQCLLHRFLRKLRVAKLRKGVADEIAAVALDLREARIRCERWRHGRQRYIGRPAVCESRRRHPAAPFPG